MVMACFSAIIERKPRWTRGYRASPNNSFESDALKITRALS
jgi:hypothetical protein